MLTNYKVLPDDVAKFMSIESYDMSCGLIDAVRDVYVPLDFP